MRTVTSLAIIAALAGCTLQDLGGTNRKQVFNATSKYELLDMGGKKLTGEEITLAMSGKTLVEPNKGWVWQIGTDGHQEAHAEDGSWADPPDGTWRVKDDTFCTKNSAVKERCSQVYQVGKFLRFVNKDGALYDYTVTEG